MSQSVLRGHIRRIGEKDLCYSSCEVIVAIRISVRKIRRLLEIYHRWLQFMLVSLSRNTAMGPCSSVFHQWHFVRRSDIGERTVLGVTCDTRIHKSHLGLISQSCDRCKIPQIRRRYCRRAAMLRGRAERGVKTQSKC